MVHVNVKRAQLQCEDEEFRARKPKRVLYFDQVHPWVFIVGPAVWLAVMLPLIFLLT